MTKSNKTETFFSIDIEADGPYPGDFSMLSFAAVAFGEEGILGSFETNLAPLEGAKQSPRTMKEFWAKEPVAWEYCTRNPQDPGVAMPRFVKWVNRIQGDLKTAVCMPAGFDFMFMYWYMKKFAGESPFSFSCIDMKTYAMAFRRKPYRYSGKGSWPGRWFVRSLPHTHKAIDDALEQGMSFMLMRQDRLSGEAVREKEMANARWLALETWKECEKVSLVGERAEGDPVPEIET
jgi:hypothetical protein